MTGTTADFAEHAEGHAELDVNANYRPIVSSEELAGELEHRGAMTGLVRQALEQAERSHRGQIRRDGTEYLDGHVFPIAYDLAVTLDRDDPDYEYAIAAAILHDTVEDDPQFPPERLARSFPERIGRAVMLVTNHPYGNEPRFNADHEKLAFNRSYINRIHDSNDRVAQLVKLADRLNNTLSARDDPSLVVESIDDPRLDSKIEKQARKLQEVEELFLPMAEDVSYVYLHRLVAACNSLRAMLTHAQQLQAQKQQAA